MSNLRPKRITDCNGRLTTVYVKDDSVSSGRTTVAPVSASIPFSPGGATSWDIVNGYLDEEVDIDKVVATLEDFETQYGDFEVGRTRAVFDRGDGFVLKVAINGEGVMANYQEQRLSQSDDQFIPIAKTEYYDDVNSGVSVVLMEKVTPYLFGNYKNVPDWVGFVDGGQVGHTVTGKLVAYDL